MSMNNITPRELDALRTIADLTAELDGLPPSVREIAGRLSISTTRVEQLLLALVRHGLATHQPRKARALWLSPEGHKILGGHGASRPPSAAAV